MRRPVPVSLVLASLLAFALAAAAIEAPPAPPPPEEAPAAETDGPWLGVLLGNAVDGGAQVVALVPQGPAAKAGILEGDVILAIDGTPTPDRAALGRAITVLAPGQTARVSVLRGGESLTRMVAIAKRSRPVPLPRLPKRRLSPQPSPGWEVAGWSGGMSVATIPRELRVHYGAPADAGVLVTSVDPGGPADAAKVQVGDILVSVDGASLSEAYDLPRRLVTSRDPASVPLALVRDRKAVTVRMSLASFVQHESYTVSPMAPEAVAGYADAEKIMALEEEVRRLTERLAAIEQELRRVQQDP